MASTPELKTTMLHFLRHMGRHWIDLYVCNTSPSGEGKPGIDRNEIEATKY